MSSVSSPHHYLHPRRALLKHNLREAPAAPPTLPYCADTVTFCDVLPRHESRATSRPLLGVTERHGALGAGVTAVTEVVRHG